MRHAANCEKKCRGLSRCLRNMRGWRNCKVRESCDSRRGSNPRQRKTVSGAPGVWCNMIRLTRRLALALWAFRHSDRLLSLHRDLLHDARTMQDRMDRNPRPAPYYDYEHGRRDAASMYSAQLYTMPGADDNRRAL